ncbi:MAG: hypothetical protein IKE94_09085 [Aeriscardovia sp.]|nr:hypothetical protein [Aeriscardovia sp.]MBR2755071.1 hypothetical protein [Lachnospiraceae bacterium]
MVLADQETKQIIRKLQLARLQLFQTQPFYGLLLMHVKFSLDLMCDTVYTDGERIAFNPEYLKDISASDLEFVLMHEILHIVLQHCFRKREDWDQEKYDKACDIVVNSNILYSHYMDQSSIVTQKQGEAEHKAPDDKEGYLYTAEEVYMMLKKKEGNNQSTSGSKQSNEKMEKDDPTKSDNGGPEGHLDDHSRWQDGKNGREQGKWWNKKAMDAAKVIEEMQDKSVSDCGTMPLGVIRTLEELKKPQLDWRTILNDFIQEEDNDYSFSPPDRRYGDSPFFLPDFSEKNDKTENILFMIDTSKSMSRKMITEAMTEIQGAIDQFGGKLKGWLGFFDSGVIEPKPFESEDELQMIKAAGGGGTSFHAIFDYLKQNPGQIDPVSIVILTDGAAAFPEEYEANGVPVLWIINNEEYTPPWGKVARMKEEVDVPFMVHSQDYTQIR